MGPYRIERILGRGGMGIVYAGIDPSTNKGVAVKALSPVLADDENFRERFNAEIESLRKLRHPRIVELYGYGEHDGHLFYAMELLTGGNLQEEINAGRRYRWRETIQIAMDVCRALKHAHDMGIVHRDLKPANLLLDDQERIKLSDFGIAKLFGYSQVTSPGGVLGTADYMAPEQAAGQPVTGKADLYALGGVMFCLLAGRPPFRGETAAEVVHQLRYEVAPRIGQFVWDVPHDLEELIDRLLQKDPRQRIPTPLALLHRLESLEEALTVLADPVVEIGREVPGGLAPGEAEQLAQMPTAPMPAEKGSGSKRSLAPSGPRPGAAAESAPADAPALTSSSSSTSSTASASQFVRVRRDAVTEANHEKITSWLMVVAIGAVASGIMWGLWYVQRPPGADRLYARIVEAIESERLADATGDIDEFTRRFAEDSRIAEVRRHAKTLELDRLDRRFQMAIRNSERMNASPLGMAYTDALRKVEADPVGALEQLQALLDVFGETSDRETTKEDLNTLELAQRKIIDLNLRIKGFRKEYSPILSDRLDLADQLDAERPEEAARIREGIIRLYDRRGWADEYVERARRARATRPDKPSATQAP